MNVASTAAIALAMSTDAFAAAIGKGAQLDKPRFSEALRTGVIFGVIEALTPIVGWMLGVAAASYVTAWDHWIAFAILATLGLRMVYEGAAAKDDEPQKPSTHSFRLLALTAFATSIDAMAIGVTLAFLDANIWITAAAIGTATLAMVTIGIMLGRALGRIAGKRAELLGGLLLIAIGSLILYEHLTASSL